MNSFLAAALLSAPAAAAAADVAVTGARIQAGKLVITGTTAAPRMRVRLDGESAGDFNAVSQADKTFEFSVVHLPTDCIITLEVLGSGSSLRARTDAVVANCARGISPRGRWSASASYSGNDLITHAGSSWLARRGNANQPPAEGADWQLFAAGGGPEQKPASAGSATAKEATAAARRTSPTGPAGGALSGTYPDPNIRSGAVTAGKLADDSVNANKIGDDAVGSSEIINDSITSADLRFDSVGHSEIATDAVSTVEIIDGTVNSANVRNESLTAADLAGSSVGTQEIATDGVSATEVAANSIDSDEIVDFSLTNQDIGVLFAEVNSDATLANSSGGVTVVNLAGEGTYEVDFGRDIALCTAVATLGRAGT